VYVGLGPVVSRARFLINEVLDRGAQAAIYGFARCELQVLDRGSQADARGATHVLDRGVQAISRGAARCALHVHGRGAKTDACGRSFAVLTPQVSAVGLRLRHKKLGEVPRPMPAAPRRYLIVVYRPLPAAPLDVCCIYLAVVPRPMHAAVASRCFRRRVQQLACARDTKCWRVAECLK
jgi:hypothetical protein